MSAAPPVVVFTGTKAQFIKLVPVIAEFERRQWPYRLIDTGQHASLIASVIRQYGLRPPDHSLAPGSRGVATGAQGLRWAAGLAAYLLWSPDRLRREVFGGGHTICLVHGDTISTLLATLIARRAGQRVAHVEAGLRSFSFFHPFPEELVRVLVMRRADLLFAPSPAARDNLIRMGLGHRSVLLPGNTGLDTLALTLAAPPPTPPAVPTPFGLATVHRLETIYRTRVLSQVVEFVIEAHRRVPMVWVEHPPTARRLASSGLDARLAGAGVTRLPLQPHGTFVRLLQQAEFVMTDGGSVQEEAYALGTPCLILRRATERDDGLGENAVLSGLSATRIRDFLDRYQTMRRAGRTAMQPGPSAVIADTLERFWTEDG